MGFLDPKALRDWIKSRAVNNLMATAKGFFLDARVGPVIQEKIDEVKEEVNEINGNLAGFSSASLEVNQACAAEVGINRGMCFRYGNLVIVKAILGGMHFFSNTHLFIAPLGYRPHTNVAGTIMCRRYVASTNTPLFAFSILVTPDGRIFQQFNGDGESTIWEGEIFVAYTTQPLT